MLTSKEDEGGVFRGEQAKKVTRRCWSADTRLDVGWSGIEADYKDYFLHSLSE